MCDDNDSTQHKLINKSKTINEKVKMYDTMLLFLLIFYFW